MKAALTNLCILSILSLGDFVTSRAICAPSGTDLRAPGELLGSGDAALQAIRRCSHLFSYGDGLVKRAFTVPKPTNPFRDPSPGPPSSSGGSSPSNPFRDPSTPTSQGSNPFRDPSLSGSPSSSDSNPFRVPGKPDAGLEAQRRKGLNVLDDFKSASGADRGSTKSLDEAGYSGQQAVDAEPFAGTANGAYLVDFGVKTDVARKHSDIKLSASNEQDKLTILETFQSQEQRCIIVKQSWGKEQDPNGALPWTAMVMSNWRSTAGSDTKNLKFVVRDHIQPIDTVSSDGVKLNTVDAIRQAFARTQKPTDQTLVLSSSTSQASVDEIAAFQLMVAQTHVARVYQMLKDYRTELGNLDIVRLHLQTPAQNPQAVAQYNIIVELGPRVQ